MARALEEEGIEIELHSDVSKVTNSAAEKFVTLTGGDKERQVTCDQIRVAVGRAPSLEGLGLDRAGVQVHARGIRINDYLQTTKPHIFAVGDCNGGPQFTHWAEHEARIATRNVLFRGRSRRKLERIPWVTFTDPEVARVGLTYEEAQAKGLFPHIHELAMDHVDRAVCVGESRGKIRVVLDRREKILGVHIVAAGAGELLSEWVLAMDKGLRLGDIGKSIHVYPTLSRANRRVPDEAFFAHGLPAWIRRFLGKYRGR